MNWLKNNIKSLFFIFGVLLILIFLWYTNSLVHQLREQLRDYLVFKIRILEESINRDPGGDVSFVFDQIIRTADFPIIYTDGSNRPLYWRNIPLPQVPPDSLLHAQQLQLMAILEKLDRTNSPIAIRYDTLTLGYYHYGDSPVIVQLQRLPYIEVAIVVLFILLAYIGFNAMKNSEKRILWIGMSKETAHQLGTPTSSLLGWLEVAEQNGQIAPEILEEMKHDVQRLMKITERFSKIGSSPVLEALRLCPIILETVAYFRRRLPQGRNHQIQFFVECPDTITIKGNKDLLEWTFENLIKNALDAIENGEGSIRITVHEDSGWYYIDVQDTGKGIESHHHKKIFEPGFSTKKRGWGLGLSLVKRIIEEYHNGKIFVLKSQPGMGSTFRIQLKK